MSLIEFKYYAFPNWNISNYFIRFIFRDLFRQTNIDALTTKMASRETLRLNEMAMAYIWIEAVDKYKITTDGK